MAETSGSPTYISVVSTSRLLVSIVNRVKELDQYKLRHMHELN